MIARAVLLVLLPVTAAFALSQRRRLHAIIGMAVFSLLLASVFFLAHAPDVAITEAAIGAALVTLVYVLAIRKTGRLVVVACQAPGLIAREGDRIVGLEWEILKQLAETVGLDAVVRFVSHDEATAALLRGDADIGAGGLLADEVDSRLVCVPGHLPTARFDVIGPRDGTEAWPSDARPELADVIDAVRRRAPLSITLDLARFLALSRYDLDAYAVRRRDGDPVYAFALSPTGERLRASLVSLLDRLRTTGELDETIRRYFP